MTDFNQLAPPTTVTNPSPTAPPKGEYPRHLHRWAGTAPDGSPLLNEYVEVNSDAEKTEKLAEGWSLQPLTEAPVDSGKSLQPLTEAPVDSGKNKKK